MIEMKLVMEHLTEVLEAIAAHEKDLQLAIDQFLNASNRGEDPVLRFRGMVFSFETALLNFSQLHFHNPAPNKRIMTYPERNAEGIKAILKQKIRLAEKLGIPHEKTTSKIADWLNAGNE